MINGSCMCGAVKFEISSALDAADACHCTQCRKQSGHFFASAEVSKSHVSIQGAEYITWFQSSEKVRRGFCKVCGSSLFWDPVHRDWTAVAMGVIDDPTNVRLAKHIFVANKGDYYDIEDGLPQNAQ